MSPSDTYEKLCRALGMTKEELDQALDDLIDVALKELADNPFVGVLLPIQFSSPVLDSQRLSRSQRAGNKAPAQFYDALKGEDPNVKDENRTPDQKANL